MVSLWRVAENTMVSGEIFSRFQVIWEDVTRYNKRGKKMVGAVIKGTGAGVSDRVSVSP